MLEKGDTPRPLLDAAPNPQFSETRASVANNGIIESAQKRDAAAVASRLHDVHIGPPPPPGASPLGKGADMPASLTPNQSPGSGEVLGSGQGKGSVDPMDKYFPTTEQKFLPNGQLETTTYDMKGKKEVEARDEFGRLRSADTIEARTSDGKLDSTIHQSWDDQMKLQENNQRWHDEQGVWHERNFMRTPDNMTIAQTMDGDRTRTDTIFPNGQKTTEIKTVNVPSSYEYNGTTFPTSTMTIERSESGP
jgi:hypothetical protein